MDKRYIFLCENTTDGIFTAIYDAWASGYPDEMISLYVEENHDMELFAEYRYVQTDYDKAKKVARSVSRKISTEAYVMIFRASLSQFEDKVEVIYRFLKLGFREGRNVTGMHGEEVVCRLFELSRNVWTEAHLFQGVVRFHDSKDGLLISRISPKNLVLPMVAEHFAERFSTENFIILDDKHNMGLFHEREQSYFISTLERDVLEEIWASRDNSEYESLWKCFFRNIAIDERENYNCQRNLCPIRYREYMVEFQS